MFKKIVSLSMSLFLLVFLGASMGQSGIAFAKEEKSSHESSGGKSEKEGEALVKEPEFEYFQMQPLLLPVITDKGLTQQVSMVVSIEVPFGKKDDVKEYAPRLADAYIQDLYGALSAGDALMRGNIVNIQAVKERLTTVTTRVLGEDKFHGVLLQVVSQHVM